MRILKPVKMVAAALAVLFAVGTAMPVSAVVYTDVPASHWGYADVNRVTDLGFMSGDLLGNFKPNDYIDKFETAKILARMAGYKYTGATAAETEYYNNCYNKHIGFINLYANKFSLWNANANKEIAFLLEKGILVNDDLNQFVVMVNNRESLRALSREEAAVFLVRVMGRTSQLSTTNTNLFADDASITAACKPSVYYLRNVGVVSGGTGNAFSPKSAVVKVAMASMINRAWNIMNPAAPATPPPAATPAPGANYVSVSGTIAKVFADFRAIQVSSSDANNSKIFPAASAATISINGQTKAFADLREGMSFTGLVLNGELVQVAAIGAATQPAGEIPAGSSVLEGIVRTADGKTIGIEVRMLNPRGEIYTEIRTYAIPTDCVITRGNKTATAASIAKDDIVKATINNGVLRRLELQEKDRKFIGEIVAKRTSQTSFGVVPIITIKDADGNLSEMTVSDKTVITRRGVGTTEWYNIRVGDEVDVVAEYDNLVTLYAYGKNTTIEGIVREIHISEEGSALTVENTAGARTVYPIVPGKLDPYTVRVGSRLRIYLDSKEIEGITVLQSTTATGYTGIITRVNSSVIVIKDAVTGVSREFTMDSSTVFRNTVTDRVVNVLALDINMRVHIAVDAASSTRARTVSIL